MATDGPDRRSMGIETHTENRINRSDVDGIAYFRTILSEDTEDCDRCGFPIQGLAAVFSPDEGHTIIATMHERCAKLAMRYGWSR